MKLHSEGTYYSNGRPVDFAEGFPTPEEGKIHTMAAKILYFHSRSGDIKDLAVSFDALISHDITYVGIIQTARAAGLEAFPLPYAMTNCHNSLCAVGGTVNADDHAFGLAAAKKYGGIYVPENLAVIHMYARECLAACGNMILGSDSHTRYGALGTLGVGEGGPELVKQLLGHTYDIEKPETVLVYVTGTPKAGVGPHDVALALVKATFESGFVKNRILEFAGPGIANLNVDFRCGVDVMTTETGCLSSVWETDDKVRAYYELHGREEAFEALKPDDKAYYERWIELDLSEIESMIALPFHPSNAYPIHTFNDNAADILHAVDAETERLFEGKIKLNLSAKRIDGRVYADQGVIAGCAGGLFDNICDAAKILKENGASGTFPLSVYPGSLPVEKALCENGVLSDLLSQGAIVKPAFCGPCFGAGDVPKTGALSIRHTTRNFVNREGAKPNENQLAGVALMDARSIAASAVNGGAITAATDLAPEGANLPYTFDGGIYEKRVYAGFPFPKPETELILGSNITDWPKFQKLGENLLVELAAVITDPVTTTDELIPSGETSAYRSNPERLSEYTLSRRVPEYVARAKASRALEAERLAGGQPKKLLAALEKVSDDPKALLVNTQTGSCIYAARPGDGSAREQAASCQKVLGGLANIALSYATKRYRSNCINWGILPFTLLEGESFALEVGDYVFVPDIRAAVSEGRSTVSAKAITKTGVLEMTLCLPELTDDARDTLLNGCLINFYASADADAEEVQ